MIIINKRMDEATRFRVCGVMETLALVASLAGTGATIAGAEQAKAAENNKVKAELLRQQAFQKQNQATVGASLAADVPAKVQQNLDTGKNAALAQYSKLQQVPITLWSLGS
jgi:hypothetical protein